MTHSEYTERFFANPNSLEVVYFKPGVLDRYEEDPDYRVTESRVSTRDGVSVPPSGVQQYVSAHAPSGPCIAVYLAHLRTLSARDQLHWKSYELLSDDADLARIDERHYEPMILGEFSSKIGLAEALFLDSLVIDRVLAPHGLFPNLPATMPSFLRPLSVNSRRAYSSFALDTTSLLKMRAKTLAAHLTPADGDVTKWVKSEQTGNLLRAYFNKHALWNDLLEDFLEVLKSLSKFRQERAHELVEAICDDDYMILQTNAVRRLQAGLRCAMYGFAQTQGFDLSVERHLKRAIDG